MVSDNDINTSTSNVQLSIKEKNYVLIKQKTDMSQEVLVLEEKNTKDLKVLIKKD